MRAIQGQRWQGLNKTQDLVKGGESTLQAIVTKVAAQRKEQREHQEGEEAGNDH